LKLAGNTYIWLSYITPEKALIELTGSKSWLAGPIKIVCISTEEGFAKEVYEYLYATLEKQQHFKEGESLLITREAVRLVENDEIVVGPICNVPDKMIKWVLDSYLEANVSRFPDYRVIWFEDTFTIGRIVPLEKIGLFSCDLCNYTTAYLEQLNGHRYMHYAGQAH